MVSSSEASAEFRSLVTAPSARLRATMQRGTRPDPDTLVGREFRGANSPRMAAVLGIRRFVKGFTRQDSGAIAGYNVRVTGSDLASPWTTVSWRGQREFGFFSVTPVDPEAADNHHLNALLLNYGAMGSGPNPVRAIRDYVVQVQPESELLLGHAFMAVGSVRTPLSFFVLEPL